MSRPAILTPTPVVQVGGVFAVDKVGIGPVLHPEPTGIEGVSLPTLLTPTPVIHIGAAKAMLQRIFHAWYCNILDVVMSRAAGNPLLSMLYLIVDSLF